METTRPILVIKVGGDQSKIPVAKRCLLYMQIESGNKKWGRTDSAKSYIKKTGFGGQKEAPNKHLGWCSVLFKLQTGTDRI